MVLRNKARTNQYRIFQSFQKTKLSVNISILIFDLTCILYKLQSFSNWLHRSDNKLSNTATTPIMQSIPCDTYSFWFLIMLYLKYYSILLSIMLLHKYIVLLILYNNLLQLFTATNQS